MFNVFLVFVVLYFIENCDIKFVRYNFFIILGFCWYKVKILFDLMLVLLFFKFFKICFGFNNIICFLGGEVFIKVIYFEEWCKGI